MLGGYLGEGSDASVSKVRALSAGVAGAIVAITFASGPIEYSLNELYDVFSNSKEAKFSKSAHGFFRLFAVSILGGYLGVLLLDKISQQLLAADVTRLKSEMNEIKEWGDVNRLMRASSELLEGGFSAAAWEVVKEIPKARPEDLARLRLWRGYVLKRLDDLDQATLEVGHSLQIKETYEGWYNKACYMALVHNKDPARGSVNEIRESLMKAETIARAGGVWEKLLVQIRIDARENGDLYSLQSEDFVQRLIC